MKRLLFFIIASGGLLFSVVRPGASHGEMLTLSQGLQLAAESNRTIKISKHQENISEADTFIARAPLLPSVNASAGQTFLAYQPAALFGAQIVPTSEKSFLSYSLNVRQLLYDFEGSVSRYRAGKAILEARKFDTRRVGNLVSLEFTIAYFDLLESGKLMLVAQKEVESVEAHLRDAKNLYDGGMITKNDLLQAEVRLSDARQRLLNARNLRSVNASRLNTMLSRPLNTDIQVMDLDVPPSASIVPDREEAWETAVQQRPEIKIVDETIKSLGLEEISKKSEYYPKFYADASYGYAENRFQLHQGNASLFFGMTFNLFSGGDTSAGLQKAGYQKAQLEEQRARLDEAIRLEVEKNILDLNNAAERARVAKDAVGQAEENLRINKVRYEEGVGTATEALDAVTLLTVAQTNYYRALYDLRRAEAAALYSMGKDLLEVYK